jgi:hypothetical protein
MSLHLQYYAMRAFRKPSFAVIWSNFSDLQYRSTKLFVRSLVSPPNMLPPSILTSFMIAHSIDGTIVKAGRI